MVGRIGPDGIHLYFCKKHVCVHRILGPYLTVISKRERKKESNVKKRFFYFSSRSRWEQ